MDLWHEELDEGQTDHGMVCRLKQATKVVQRPPPPVSKTIATRDFPSSSKNYLDFVRARILDLAASTLALGLAKLVELSAPRG